MIDIDSIKHYLLDLQERICSEFVDIDDHLVLKTDEWQLTNLWSTLPAAKKEALQAEIAHRFQCTGTRTTPSDCE